MLLYVDRDHSFANGEEFIKLFETVRQKTRLIAKNISYVVDHGHHSPATAAADAKVADKMRAQFKKIEPDYLELWKAVDTLTELVDLCDEGTFVIGEGPDEDWGDFEVNDEIYCTAERGFQKLHDTVDQMWDQWDRTMQFCCLVPVWGEPEELLGLDFCFPEVDPADGGDTEPGRKRHLHNLDTLCSQGIWIATQIFENINSSLSRMLAAKVSA